MQDVISPEAPTAREVRRPAVRAALWLASTAAFPIAGLAAIAVAGPTTTPVAAAVGGATAGLLIGLAQSFASTRVLPLLRWSAATTIGSGVGLLAGAGLVGFRTGLVDLAAQGAVTGAVIGILQAAVLPTPHRRRWIWLALSPLVWAAGWSVTTLAGIDVSQHFAVFGLSGALAATVLTGVSLQLLLGPASDRRA